MFEACEHLRVGQGRAVLPEGPTGKELRQLYATGVPKPGGSWSQCSQRVQVHPHDVGWNSQTPTRCLLSSSPEEKLAGRSPLVHGKHIITFSLLQRSNCDYPLWEL